MIDMAEVDELAVEKAAEQADVEVEANPALEGDPVTGFLHGIPLIGGALGGAYDTVSTAIYNGKNAAYDAVGGAAKEYVGDHPLGFLAGLGGVGAGALAGGKLGFVIGGPPGAAIGAGIGGLVGLIGGNVGGELLAGAAYDKANEMTGGALGFVKDNAPMLLMGGAALLGGRLLLGGGGGMLGNLPLLAGAAIIGYNVMADTEFGQQIKGLVGGLFEGVTGAQVEGGTPEAQAQTEATTQAESEAPSATTEVTQESAAALRDSFNAMTVNKDANEKTPSSVPSMDVEMTPSFA